MSVFDWMMEDVDRLVSAASSNPCDPWNTGWPEGQLERLLVALLDRGFGKLWEDHDYPNLEFRPSFLHLGAGLAERLPAHWVPGEKVHHSEVGVRLMLDWGVVDVDGFELVLAFDLDDGGSARMNLPAFIPPVPLPAQQWQLYTELRVGGLPPSGALAAAQAALAEPRTLAESEGTGTV